MNNTDISIFRREGVDIRVVTVEGAPWFAANDVALVLDLGNPRSSLALLDDDERAVHSMDTPGGTQSVTVISESGLYSLILRSRKPEAAEFKRWVTREVLPTIRKTGSYAVEPQRALPHDFASALRELLSEVESHEETRAELAESAPRAEAWDALASAEGDYSVGDAAKVLARAGIPTGPTRLFNDLARIKWTFRGGDGAWRAYAERVEKGYLTEKLSFRYHPGTGERIANAPQVRITAKGIDRLRQRLHVGALQAVGS